MNQDRLAFDILTHPNQDNVSNWSNISVCCFSELALQTSSLLVQYKADLGYHLIKMKLYLAMI